MPYRAAENMIRNTGLNLHGGPRKDKGRRGYSEAPCYRDRQHELNNQEINSQSFRDESNARNTQQRPVELEHQSRATTEDLVNLSELKQRELTLREECAHKDRLQTQFREEGRRVRALAESMVTEKENKMQISFDEKYQSQFNGMQAELANQSAMLQSERDKKKQDWHNLTNSEDKAIEILKQRLLETQKALDKVST